MILFAVLYGGLHVGIWFLQSLAPEPALVAEMPEVVAVRNGLLVFFAASYALFRLVRFHPACNREYIAWLKLSPWTAGKPLPLGPVHPVWQDVAIVGILVALALWHGHANPAAPVVAFGLFYFGGLSLLLVVTRIWTSSVILGFLWPAMLVPELRGLPTIALVAAIISVIWDGQKKCLRAFPWETFPGKGGDAVSLFEVVTEKQGFAPASPSEIGWPWRPLSPRFDRASISTPASFIVSVLVAWWAYCIMRAAGTEPIPEWIFFGALGAGMGRLAVYCMGLAPSFNLRGRLASGRILVPGFDKVFVIPLAVVLLSLAGGAIIDRSGGWHPEVSACVIAVCLFVLLAGRPTLRTWVLTGQHRHQSPANARVTRERLTPL